RRSRRSAVLSVALALGGFSAPRRAAAADDDGVYGRFDGDAMAAVELGGSYTFAAPAARGPGLTARAGFFYMHTLGLTVQYDDRLGSAEAVARSLLASIEIRPIFLSRFTQDLEQGPA